MSEGKFRFTFGEVLASFVIGAMVSAYALLSLLLLRKCICDGRAPANSEVMVYLLQWGFASLGMWILAVVIGTLRKRNN